jgi:hypothetical protein
MEATEDDEVFHWGREVDVKWGMLSWVTFRDQASLTLVSHTSIPSRSQHVAQMSDLPYQWRS